MTLRRERRIHEEVESLFSSSLSPCGDMVPNRIPTWSGLDSSTSEDENDKNLDLSQEATKLAGTKSPEASKTEESSSCLQTNNITSNSVAVVAATEYSEKVLNTRESLPNESENDVAQGIKKPKLQRETRSTTKPRVRKPRTKRRKKNSEAKPEKKRAKRGRPRKSPEQKKVKLKPIKGNNPYNYYVRKMRPIVMKENPGKTFREVANIVGENWRNLPASEVYKIRLEMEEHVKNQHKVIDLAKNEDNEVEAENDDNSHNQKLPEKSQEPEVIGSDEDNSEVEKADNKLNSPRQVEVAVLDQILANYGYERVPKQ